MPLQKEWNIERSTRKCADCKTGFQVGRKYFSAIYPMAGGGFLRRDFCLSCWPRYRDGDVPPLDVTNGQQAPVIPAGEYLSYWKTGVPEPKVSEKRLRFDPQVAFTIFRQLSGVSEVVEVEKERLQFIVALSLVRHKVLKLKTIVRRENDSFLMLADRSGGSYEVRDPGIGEEEMATLMGRIGELLDMPLDDDVDEDTDGADVLNAGDMQEEASADES